MQTTYHMNILPGIYRHYKGGLYKVCHLGRIAATNEEVVVYASLQDKGGFKKGSVWIRPVAVFSETILHEGVEQPRFKRLETEAWLRWQDLAHLGVFPFVVFMLNYTLDQFNYFVIVTWGLDLLMHYLGGLSIAYSAGYAVWLLHKKGIIHIKTVALRMFAILAVVGLVAMLWEIYEFASDTYLGTHFQPSNANTMQDMMMGLLGAITYCVVWIMWRLLRVHKK